MAYGTGIYGQALFGQDLKDNGGPDLDKVDLMAYLPPYYIDVKEMEELQKQLGMELELQQFCMKDVLNQRFIQSATWGLERWERELGLPVDPSKAYERRREMLLAKLRGSGTTTKAMIMQAAAAFSGGEVEITETPGEYHFEIQFVGVMGVPLNMPGFIQLLEDIKPAHLTYSFKYTYTWWETLKSLIWNQARSKTWNELRVYEGE
ncbi:YmfQ family protein [Paenibacillus pinihumi]|uniref:YmfQ family protein n=1 Tax=Paenibacillus pinihumi TaxID=669462 RepID=UPI0003FDC1C4|nr:YmfQ family protein [Paenibacillus pinihumi]